MKLQSKSGTRRRELKGLVPLLSGAALLPGCLVDAADAASSSGTNNARRGHEAVADPSEDHPAHPSFVAIDPSELEEVGAYDADEEVSDEEVPESDATPDSGLGPLEGYTLYVEPNSRPARQAEEWRSVDPDGAALMDRMAAEPTALWIGDWDADVANTVDNAITTADDQLRVFVVYNIPNRDCGFYSAGGASDVDGYAEFIDNVARGLDGRTAVVILEPDALALTTCLSAEQRTERHEMMAAAVDTLTAAGARVYIDAGDSAWISAADMAASLIAAGIYNAAGFALNVSHTESTPDTVGYADEVRAILGDVHYVADTGRNGIGPDSEHTWCNPLGRAVGDSPTLTTGISGLDALLWIKPPGESDGDCNGGPSAGAWWPEYARDLVSRG
ncbi:MAG: glycoside hydrolase family 6 protein [Pseudomonadota bacterium]|nr:glycoside hydrolase family 6 protein [Pseudomonadota bacterium]